MSLCLRLFFVFTCGVDLLHFVCWLKLCQKHAPHTLPSLHGSGAPLSHVRDLFLFWKSWSSSWARCCKRNNMLDLMIHFASEKSEKKNMEQLDWHAMGEMQQFKGGESEWIDWKFRFLNAVGSGSLTMRKVMTFAEQNTKKDQGATYDEVIQRPEALPGPNDDWEGTCVFVKEGDEWQNLQQLGEELLDEAFGILVWPRRGGVGGASPESAASALCHG